MLLLLLTRSLILFRFIFKVLFLHGVLFLFFSIYSFWYRLLSLLYLISGLLGFFICILYIFTKFLFPHTHFTSETMNRLFLSFYKCNFYTLSIAVTLKCVCGSCVCVCVCACMRVRFCL